MKMSWTVSSPRPFAYSMVLDSMESRVILDGLILEWMLQKQNGLWTVRNQRWQWIGVPWKFLNWFSICRPSWTEPLLPFSLQTFFVRIETKNNINNGFYVRNWMDIRTHISVLFFSSFSSFLWCLYSSWKISVVWPDSQTINTGFLWV